MSLTEIAQEVIRLSAELDQARLAQSAADVPTNTSGCISGFRSSATYAERELFDYILTQPPRVVFMLAALMYLGRGDFGPKGLQAAYREVSETFVDSRLAAREMVGKVSLTDYLQKGLEKLGGTNVNALLS